MLTRKNLNAHGWESLCGPCALRGLNLITLPISYVICQKIGGSVSYDLSLLSVRTICGIRLLRATRALIDSALLFSASFFPT